MPVFGGLDLDIFITISKRRHSTTDPTYVYKTCSKNNKSEKKKNKTNFFIENIFFSTYMDRVKPLWALFCCYIRYARFFEYIYALKTPWHTARSLSRCIFFASRIRNYVFAVKWIEFCSLYSVDKRPATSYIQHNRSPLHFWIIIQFE